MHSFMSPTTHPFLSPTTALIGVELEDGGTPSTSMRTCSARDDSSISEAKG